LADGRTIEGIATGCHVIDPDGDNVTATQLAIDSKVEEGKISPEVLHLQLGSD
jgi:hypothetical protein